MSVRELNTHRFHATERYTLLDTPDGEIWERSYQPDYNALAVFYVLTEGESSKVLGVEFSDEVMSNEPLRENPAEYLQALGIATLASANWEEFTSGRLVGPSLPKDHNVRMHLLTE